MKKTVSIGVIFALAGLFLGIFIAPVSSKDKVVNHAAEKQENLNKNYDHLIRFGNILDVIEQVYVDEPDIDKIMDKAIEAVVASLDPHSEYLNQKRYKELLEQTSGSFGGLGIRVQMIDGLVKAVKVLEDTPAMRVGLEDNDLITKIDDVQVKTINLSEAIDMMRGEVGSPIELMVKREGEAELLKFNLNREIIKLNPVTYEAKGKIGYISLSSFTESTERNLKKAVEALTKEIGKDQIKGIILNLRGNGGGLLNQAIYTVDLFLKEGEITSTRGRDESQTLRFNAETGDMTKGLKIVILIDGDTASSSEIVSGALQDYERATIIGTRSFGKGSVQTIMPIGNDSSALRITTARYYTPSGRSIQAQGIVPDWIVKPIVPDALQEFATDHQSEATLDGHLTNDIAPEDEGKDLGSYSYVPRDEDTDIQLIYALKFLNEEVKLGGTLPDLEAEIKSNIEAEWAKNQAEIDALREKAKQEAADAGSDADATTDTDADAKTDADVDAETSVDDDDEEAQKDEASPKMDEATDSEAKPKQ